MKKYKRLFLGIEFFLLFFAVPLMLYLGKSLIYPSSVLLPILLALILYFRKQKDFHWRDLFSLNISKGMWAKQIMLLLFTALLLLTYVYVFEPENLFNLPKQNPLLWVGMLFFYPVFSAYGQEILFRKFLFMRYRRIFNGKYILIFASGLAFGFAHILFFNILSLVLTFFAGIYLALMYEKTKSVLFVSILHGFMGFLIFTFGLGQHFWLDMFKRL
jgi:CAAX protease family protein